jgi:hypothetical protein
MPFNSTDHTQPPYTAGVMTLTHEECVSVKAKCQTIIENFKPTMYQETIDDFYVISKYNELDYSKAINGDTYQALKAYDVETMDSGIPAQASIEEQPEQPTEG